MGGEPDKQHESLLCGCLLPYPLTSSDVLNQYVLDSLGWLAGECLKWSLDQLMRSLNPHVENLVVPSDQSFHHQPQVFHELQPEHFPRAWMANGATKKDTTGQPLLQRRFFQGKLWRCTVCKFLATVSSFNVTCVYSRYCSLYCIVYLYDSCDLGSRVIYRVYAYGIYNMLICHPGERETPSVSLFRTVDASEIRPTSNQSWQISINIIYLTIINVPVVSPVFLLANAKKHNPHQSDEATEAEERGWYLTS